MIFMLVPVDQTNPECTLVYSEVPQNNVFCEVGCNYPQCNAFETKSYSSFVLLLPGCQYHRATGISYIAFDLLVSLYLCTFLHEHFIFLKLLNSVYIRLCRCGAVGI